MAYSKEYEDLDEEIKELIENYKSKKATSYEPCTLKNFKECLIGIHEELELQNVQYIFNPHLDVESDTLSSEALVKLINAFWTLLHHHKNLLDKSEKLSELNHSLENNNKQLNCIVNKLKDKVNLEKNESRACVASAQRISDRSEEVHTSLAGTRAKLLQASKQKDAIEKSLGNAIQKLKQENEKLVDRLRYKSGAYTPCSDVCDTTIVQLKERERKQRIIIENLQKNNHKLIQELLTLKEDLLLEGLQSYTLDDQNKKIL